MQTPALVLEFALVMVIIFVSINNNKVIVVAAVVSVAVIRNSVHY